LWLSLCRGRLRINITFQPYYPAATLINLIVSPTLALTIFLPLLGPFSLIYFLTSTKGIKYFYSLITRILLFSKMVFIFYNIQYNAELLVVSSNSRNRNKRKLVFCIEYVYTSSYFIVLFMLLTFVKLLSHHQSIADSALRWLNVLGSISNQTSVIYCYNKLLRIDAKIYYYTVMDFIYVYTIYTYWLPVIIVGIYIQGVLWGFTHWDIIILFFYKTHNDKEYKYFM